MLTVGLFGVVCASIWIDTPTVPLLSSDNNSDKLGTGDLGVKNTVSLVRWEMLRPKRISFVMSLRDRDWAIGAESPFRFAQGSDEICPFPCNAASSV